MACLGDDTIAAMLEGGLAELDARRARTHITSCDACRRLVSAAIDSGDSGDPDPAGSTLLDLARRFTTQPAIAAPPSSVVVGSTLAGRYVIERALGEGGMGR